MNPALRYPQPEQPAEPDESSAPRVLVLDPLPRDPENEVRLVGEDGNAFAILGRVLRELRVADIAEADVQTFLAEATSGDYHHLLRTVMRSVTML